MLLALSCAIAIPARAQTAKPGAASPQQTADAAARKQLAAYMTDFRGHPEDSELRDEIIDLAKTLRPAPAVPQAARVDFATATAKLDHASTAEEFKAAAGLFDQVTTQAPWWAAAYLNAAKAYAKAADLENAKRSLTLFMKAVRPGADTTDAESLQRDIEQQQAAKEEQARQQQMQQALQEFQKNPSDAAREQIIKLAQAMRAPPAIPEEARGHYVMAATFVESAKDNAGYERAIGEYKAALLAAPWWGDAYKKLAIAQKAAEHYDDAIASLSLYLLTQPADARDAQDEIYKLKALKQTAVDEQARRQREQQQQAREAQQAQRAREEAERARLNSVEGSWCYLRVGRFLECDGVSLVVIGQDYDGAWTISYSSSPDYSAHDISQNGRSIAFTRSMRGQPQMDTYFNLSLSSDGSQLTGTVTWRDTSDVKFARQ
jgi:hypothetical protein